VVSPGSAAGSDLSGPDRAYATSWAERMTKGVTYAGSYTEKVIGALRRAWFFNDGAPVGADVINDAINLLKQYHRDLHIPYEQRDAARKERDLYKREAEKAREYILTQRGVIARFRDRIQRFKDEIKRLQAVTANCRDHRSDHSALVTELKMARGVVAYHNLYGTTTIIDCAIEELSK
jgi:hypothetical protein